MVLELTCPVCGHTFEVEMYDCGDCPKCGKADYYWEDGWNCETEETIEECSGYYWDVHKDKI